MVRVGAEGQEGELRPSSQLAAHLLLCSLVPNWPLTSTCPGPRGWGQQRSRIPGNHCAHTRIHTCLCSLETPLPSPTASSPALAQLSPLSKESGSMCKKSLYYNKARRVPTGGGQGTCGTCPSSLKQRSPGDPGG